MNKYKIILKYKQALEKDRALLPPDGILLFRFGRGVFDQVAERDCLQVINQKRTEPLVWMAPRLPTSMAFS